MVKHNRRQTLKGSSESKRGNKLMTKRLLILEDGTIFEGQAFCRS